MSQPAAAAAAAADTASAQSAYSPPVVNFRCSSTTIFNSKGERNSQHKLTTPYGSAPVVVQQPAGSAELISMSCAASSSVERYVLRLGDGDQIGSFTNRLIALCLENRWIAGSHIHNLTVQVALPVNDLPPIGGKTSDQQLMELTKDGFNWTFQMGSLFCPAISNPDRPPRLTLQVWGRLSQAQQKKSAPKPAAKAPARKKSAVPATVLATAAAPPAAKKAKSARMSAAPKKAKRSRFVDDEAEASGDDEDEEDEDEDEDEDYVDSDADTVDEPPKKKKQKKAAQEPEATQPDARLDPETNPLATQTQ